MIIGFCGEANSGKTISQKYLLSKIKRVHPITLAHPIKKITKKIYNLSLSQVYGTLKEKETIDPRYNLAPRQLLQDLGSLLRDELYEDIWVESAYNRMLEIDAANGEKHIFVIDDVRYYNEVKFLKDRDAVMIKLECPDNAKSQYSEHQSEQMHLIPSWYFDYKIVCNKSDNAKLLKNTLDGVISDLINKKYPIERDLHG